MRFKSIRHYIIPLVIGTLFFLFIFGFNILNPHNIEWLNREDALQGYLGWEFFRNSGWNFPIIGLSPNYGLDVSSSIIYTDSNPLLAIIFKIISAILPDTFQYFGIWLLLCCILTSTISWKIVSLYTESTALLIFSVFLFMFNPAWINRVAHINLMAHFLILYSIYLCLRGGNSKNIIKWCTTISLALSIHSYIAMMVSILWGSNVVARLLTRKETKRRILIEIISIVLINIAVVYALGYLTVKNVSANGGFGLYQNNLISPFVSSGWSYFFTTKTNLQSGFEGLNFWGAGVILLLAFNSINIIKFIRKTELNVKTITFCTALPFFFLISMTNTIKIDHSVFTFPLPDRLIDLLSIFRASARFFWPITYSVITLLIFLTIKNNSKIIGTSIIIIASLLQVIDTSKGYLPSDFYFHKKTSFANNLKNDFWDTGIKDYSIIRYVPFENQRLDWPSLAKVAVDSKKGTDSVYLARIDDVKAADMNAKIADSLISGSYEDDTVYIINNRMVGLVQTKAGDNIYNIDGLNVLAPGLKTCNSCTIVNTNNPAHPAYFLGSGWSSQENFGTWNDGNTSLIYVKTNDQPTEVKIKYITHTSDFYPTQSIEFIIDNKVIKKISSTSGGEVSFTIPTSEHKKIRKIKLFMPNAFSPREQGTGTDRRKLAFGLESMEIK